MNLDSILYVQYVVLAILGVVVLVLSVVMGDTIGAVVGIGALTIGTLGLEAQDILKKVVESREVK
jgi:membrane-bound ClpP family serine protease